MIEGLTERSRRRAALWRRSNATSFGARRSGRHPDNSANFTTIIDGRLDRLGPAREVAPVGAVIATFHTRCSPPWQDWRTRRCKRSSERLAEADIPPVRGLTARIRLSFQARAHSERGLRALTKEPASGPEPPRRRGLARSICCWCNRPDRDVASNPSAAS